VQRCNTKVILHVVVPMVPEPLDELQRIFKLVLVLDSSNLPPVKLTAQLAAPPGQWVSGVPAEAAAGRDAKARAVSAVASRIVFLMIRLSLRTPAGAECSADLAQQ
jgi:hypothetical protein